MGSYFINFSELLDYAGHGSHRYVEGKNVLVACHLMYCGLTCNTITKIELLCLVLKTTDLSSSVPHEIKVQINIEDEEKSLSCSCSCAAGLSGTCKHCVAVLIHLAR